MATPTTCDDFLQIIQKSGLLNQKQFDGFIESLEHEAAASADPRKIATMMVRDGLITFFQAEQFLLGKWRGFTVGKYKLLERVGYGSMGPVFLCEHLYMKRRVAIKILPPAKAEEPAALGRFYREARASGIMNHPNLVRTHDIDQDGNLHFIVMEYVDGSSLLELVKKIGPIDPIRVAHYFSQAAKGLAHAHASGLVHRDIKPGNIMVDRSGVAKILDMGLARFFKDFSDMLTIQYDGNSVLGSADYVAPEQTLNSHEVDTRADVYSLGATMYFALAGRPMFAEGMVSQKLLWQRTRDPDPIREIRPEVPVEMAEVLHRMLAKEPNERFQTPQEVVDALSPWTQVEIPPPSPSEMPQLSPAATESSDPSRAEVPLPSPKRSTLFGGRTPQMSRPMTRIPSPGERPSYPSTGEGTSPSVRAGEGTSPSVRAGEGTSPGVRAGEGTSPGVRPNGFHMDPIPLDGPLPSTAEDTSPGVRAGEGTPHSSTAEETSARVGNAQETSVQKGSRPGMSSSGEDASPQGGRTTPRTDQPINRGSTSSGVDVRTAPRPHPTTASHFLNGSHPAMRGQRPAPQKPRRPRAETSLPPALYNPFRPPEAKQAEEDNSKTILTVLVTMLLGTAIGIVAWGLLFG